jgi:EAL domain-containing protein (putative c-di-GMP-specific phosphodiesterase class I)
MLRNAEIAMYHAKDSKQRFVVFDEQMHSRAVNLLQLETDLRKAIERCQIEVYYQPIVSLENLSLAGFEALARWKHPEKGWISPAEFIEISESADLIVPLTLIVLRESCGTIAGLMKGYPERQLFVSVNLSGKHFAHQDIVSHIRSTLDETGLDPRFLKLEITETAIMENGDVCVQILNEIKSLGVTLSIDDFGTGYSSLSYLHRFPLDTLKIDRSFVSSIEPGSQNSEIVRTVVYLAKALRLDVVAEGIESIHQLAELQRLGCEYGQGFLFSRALPKVSLDQLFNERPEWQKILLQPVPFTLERPNEIDQLRLVG